MNNLKYSPLEKLKVKRPVNRIKYITNACNKKVVLDLGCFDETALLKHFPQFYKNNYLKSEPVYVRVTVYLSFYFPKIFKLIP